MGSVGKKLLRLGNSVSPHSWFMSKEQSASMDLGGQLFGAHDDLYKPEKVAPIPSASTDNQAFAARDNQRRLARRALGRDSTVRTGPGGAPYTGAPKTLLGS